MFAKQFEAAFTMISMAIQRNLWKFKTCAQSCFVSKETSDVTVTALVQQSIIMQMLALLNEFVYEYRGNTLI